MTRTLDTTTASASTTTTAMRSSVGTAFHRVHTVMAGSPSWANRLAFAECQKECIGWAVPETSKSGLFQHIGVSYRDCIHVMTVIKSRACDTRAQESTL